MLLKYLRGLFSNLCNLIVLVSPCNHEYFIWLARVMAGEEALGDLLACLKIAREGSRALTSLKQREVRNERSGILPQ